MAEEKKQTALQRWGSKGSTPAERAARRRPRVAGTRARTPLPALLVMLVASGLLVPLLLLANSEDLALSASTTGRQLGGGEERSGRSGSTSYTFCRDAPVDYEVGGRSYGTTIPVRGECVPRGEVEPVTVRYVPDDPETISTNPRQPILYGFIAAAALGFAASLVALLRRLWLHRAARPSADQGPGGAVTPG